MLLCECGIVYTSETDSSVSGSGTYVYVHLVFVTWAQMHGLPDMHAQSTRTTGSRA